MHYSMLHPNTDIFGYLTIFREIQKRFLASPHVLHKVQANLKMSNTE